MKLIDTTNMCSHLQRKLFAPDGEYSAIPPKIIREDKLAEFEPFPDTYFDFPVKQL